MERSELIKQRDFIISEFNYHEVMDYCSCLFNAFRHLKIIEYESIAAIREEMTGYLDQYIDQCLKSQDPVSLVIGFNNKWRIYHSIDGDHKTPCLKVEFSFCISECDSGGM